MSHACRVFPASLVVLPSLLVPTASSAPAAGPAGSLVRVLGQGGCVSASARFGCAGLTPALFGAMAQIYAQIAETELAQSNPEDVPDGRAPKEVVGELR